MATKDIHLISFEGVGSQTADLYELGTDNAAVFSAVSLTVSANRTDLFIGTITDPALTQYSVDIKAGGSILIQGMVITLDTVNDVYRVIGFTPEDRVNLAALNRDPLEQF